jgi:hypothetical protein
MKWGFTLGMILGLLGACRPAWGQQITSATTGTVVDAAGVALNGATVTTTNTDRGATYVTKTNDGGIFNFVSDTTQDDLRHTADVSSGVACQSEFSVVGGNS